MHSWANDFNALLSLNGLISLLTLTVLEIVLGIDNIIFISIAVDKLPREQQGNARTIGLLLALVVRTILLFCIGWIAGLKDPFFHLGAYGVSGKALILLGGGVFLLYKTAKEIHEHIHSHDDDIGPGKKGKSTFNAIIMQIIIIDFVFSFDSILAAVGLSGIILIMVSAVVISMVLMILFSGVVAFADPIAEPGSGEDPGLISPINDYIIPMLLVVLVFGYRVLIFKKKVQTPNGF